MIFIRKHGNQIAKHMRRRWKAVQEQNGGSIPGTGFAIKDFQPLHVKPAIENGRRDRVRHPNSPSARESYLPETNPQKHATPYRNVQVSISAERFSWNRWTTSPQQSSAPGPMVYLPQSYWRPQAS